MLLRYPDNKVKPRARGWGEVRVEQCTANDRGQGGSYWIQADLAEPNENYGAAGS